jgi:hypothetical protein
MKSDQRSAVSFQQNISSRPPLLPRISFVSSELLIADY